MLEIHAGLSVLLTLEVNSGFERATSRPYGFHTRSVNVLKEFSGHFDMRESEEYALRSCSTCTQSGSHPIDVLLECKRPRLPEDTHSDADEQARPA